MKKSTVWPCCKHCLTSPWESDEWACFGVSGHGGPCPVPGCRGAEPA